jgi:hypothetical protein
MFICFKGIAIEREYTTKMLLGVLGVGAKWTFIRIGENSPVERLPTTTT